MFCLFFNSEFVAGFRPETIQKVLSLKRSGFPWHCWLLDMVNSVGGSVCSENLVDFWQLNSDFGSIKRSGWKKIESVSHKKEQISNKNTRLIKNTCLSEFIFIEYIFCSTLIVSALRFIESKNLGLSGIWYKKMKFSPFNRLLNSK